MWTSHGHHIPGSPLDEENRPGNIARCGGPNLCIRCSREAVGSRHEHVPDLHHDDETLIKVYRALSDAGVRMDGYYADGNGPKPVEIVSELQNAGILFRERGKS